MWRLWNEKGWLGMDRQSEVKVFWKLGLNDWESLCLLLDSTNIYLLYPDIQAAKTDTTSSRNHGLADKRSQKCCAQNTKISCMATFWG